MRKHLQRIAALFVVFGFAIGSANGQAGTTGIKVNVPFSFTVGQKVLSAGEYKLFSSGKKFGCKKRADGTWRRCLPTRLTERFLRGMERPYLSAIPANAFCRRCGLPVKKRGAACPIPSEKWNWQRRGQAKNTPCWARLQSGEQAVESADRCGSRTAPVSIISRVAELQSHWGEI